MKKSKEKKQKNEAKLIKNNKGIKSTILLIIIDFFAVACIFMVYGPFSWFKDTFITSAMKTMSHKYFAYVLYDQEIIDKTLSNNSVVETGATTDTTKIQTGYVEDPGVYESYYEEQILKRDNKDDIYKIVKLEGSKYKGYMVVVYDPSKVELVMAKNITYGGQKLTKLAETYKASVAINASGFIRRGKAISPIGGTIVDKEIIKGDPNTKVSLIGFSENNVLTLTYKTPKQAIADGMEDAMSFYPFLIVNGIPSTFKGNGGYGLAPRTAIGQRQDGIVLMVVIDGRQSKSLGIDMVELANIFIKYRAYNAANLDGGGSSALVENSKLVNTPTGFGYSSERYVVNGFIVTK